MNAPDLYLEKGQYDGFEPVLDL